MNKNAKKPISPEQTQNRRFSVLIIVSALVSAGLLIAGSLLGRKYPEVPKDPFWIVTAVCMAIPLILCAVTLAVKKAYVKKRNADKVKDVIASLLRQRALAKEASAKGPKKLVRIRCGFYGLAAAALLSSFAIAFLSGFAGTGSSSFYLFIFFSSVYFIAGAMIFLPLPSLTGIAQDDAALKREDFPCLYGIAEKAKSEIGLHGNIQILAEVGFNVGIAYRREDIFLSLGMLTVCSFSDDELYAVLLHEFAHLKEDPRHKKERAFMEKLSSAPSSPVFFILFKYYALCANVYYYNYVLYDYAVSVMREQEADSAMLRCKEKNSAASALIKLFFSERYDWEQWEDAVSASIYENEEPPRDLFTRYLANFRTVTKKRRADWLSMIDVEIMARSSTHPTVKMRLDALGVTDYDLPEMAPSEAYRRDISNVAAYLDDLIFKKDPEGYTASRKTGYLDPLETVSAWEEAGKPLVAEEYRNVLDALMKLCRKREAEELCDRAIAELPDPAAPTAHLIKGGFLLRRYDPAGIDHIYKAIESNSNNIEAGLSLIGTFCCYTGNSAMLETYRERAVNFAQFKKDEYDETGVLRKSDDLSAEHLPEGVLEDFLRYVKEFEDGNIDKIFLLHKKISDNFFTSAYIVKYVPEIKPEIRDDIDRRIFEYLDTVSNWQYSLFDYESVRAVRPERIEGSCVYSKDETKGA
ncbi:MAG: M48 family metalloprotease [Clostridia bacterium]|nr:M48 family metalloprotease [Clostridia bacterium]